MVSKGIYSRTSPEEANVNTLRLAVGFLLPNAIKAITGAANTEKAAKSMTLIAKNSVIEGYKVSNHAWRKSGLGRSRARH